ncbi:MAG: DUF6036 family nucleotidyltransferase [Ferruginibacter sp.]
MFEFLKTIITFLNSNNIPYMLSGSVAMSVYVLPRATRDFDFIINLSIEKIPLFIENFKGDYYCDETAVRDAVKRKSIFNIIDHQSGYKADFVLLKNTAYRQEEFGRRISTDLFGLPLYIVSAEDLLISKLIWIQELHSELQKEDIRNLAALKTLDWNYIHKWINEMKINTFDLIK